MSERLYITQAELKALTETNKRDLQAYKELKYPGLALLLQVYGYIEQILLLGWGLIPLGYLIKWTRLRKKLRKILSEVERYNDLIKAIDIGDQLEAAGNKGASISNREKVIKIQLVQEELICALKTDLILRKNHSFIIRNPKLIATDLTTGKVLQTSEQASFYGKLLDEALQEVVDVQAEMEKLQNKQ